MRERTTRWPSIPLAEWRDTRDTLHLYTQIVGKVRMTNTPLVNHWWNVTLYTTARGLTTSLMPHPTGPSFQMDFDFVASRLEVTTVDGDRRSLALEPRSVADFYARVMDLLADLRVPTRIWPMPVEIAGAVPFPEDRVHAVYDPAPVARFWSALAEMDHVFTTFRGRFLGKASPVHLFWGGLDLAATRFSGRTAPRYPHGAPNCGPQVMEEAYSHEVSSCGYWPGDVGDEGAFYSYAYPEPPGFRSAPVQPEGASWDPDLAEFVLPYELVRTAPDPDAFLLAFLQSTYEAAANSARWDRASLERRS
jgi:hypothetical protein